MCIRDSENIEKRGEGKWLLKIPDTESMVKTENVTITNVRETEVELEATKTLKGKELLAGQFQFELLADDGRTVLQEEVSNDAEGKVTFAPVTIQGEGTHTFYMKETIPEEAIENEDTLKGITYDAVSYTHLDAETDDPLDGAEFEVYYQAFDSFSGEHKVEDMTVAGNRTLIGKYTTKDGKISLTGLKPGVYYVVETKPREGYELAEDRDQICLLYTSRCV